MNTFDVVTIQILAGDGEVPGGFETQFDVNKLFGLPVKIRYLGRGPMPGGPPLGIIVNVPIAQFVSMADYPVDVLINAIRDVFNANERRVNFSLRSMHYGKGREIEVNLSAPDLHEGNIKKFFKAVTGKAGRFVKYLEMPTTAAWAVYITIDPDTEGIRDVTAMNIDNRDFYLFDPAHERWVKQSLPVDQSVM